MTVWNLPKNVNLNEGSITCANPIVQCRDDSGIHGLYREMSNVSIVLAQDVMFDIMISNVRFRSTRKGYSTYTDKHHCGKYSTWYWILDFVPDTNGTGKRAVININTRYNWVINIVHMNQEKVIWKPSYTDMDNHAETICFGTNCCPIPFTSEECNVSILLP